MRRSIFADKFPPVKTGQELEKIKQIYSEYDPYYVVSACLKVRKERFDKLWTRFEPFADSDFLNQIKKNFHQRSWEMYMGNVLLESDLEIESQDEGPDFVVNNSVYVECIAPTKGDPTKKDTVPEMIYASRPEKMQVQDVPVDRIILRITQAIKDKALDQYERWRNKDWFDSKKSFVIAVNTGDLGCMDDSSMPSVIKALFGFQFLQVNMKTGNTSYTTRNVINKSNNSSVPVNYFACPDFSFVSGVLFCSNNVLNHSDKIGNDCIFVSNPFAINPVERFFLESFECWTVTKNDEKISLKRAF